MEALLRNLTPQFLYHYPSSCIVSFEPDTTSSGMTSIYKSAGTSIYSKVPKLSASFRHILSTIVPATINEAKIYYDNLSSLWKIELDLNVYDGG